MSIATAVNLLRTVPPHVIPPIFPTAALGFSDVLVGSSIVITPQVANDLRTELRYEPTEIHYSWRRSEPSSLHTPAVLLTSFIPPESTYRPLSVPLPIQAKIGDKWQLCLFCHSPGTTTNGSSHVGGQVVLALTGPSSGCIPLSVFSEGIEITRPNPPAGGGVTKGVGAASRAKGKGKENGDAREKGSRKGKERDEPVKQTRIMREWETPYGGSLTLIEQTSFDLDKKIWDSGLALSSWLYRHIQTTDSSIHLHADPQARRLTNDVLDLLRRPGATHDILELGSGTGLVSIALWSILAQQQSRGRIVATDLDSAIDLMRENILLNQRIQPSPIPAAEAPNLEAEVLDWDQSLPTWVGHDNDRGEGSWPELIVAADVTYNTASFPALIRTLKGLLLPPRKEHRPKFLLAYKQRDPGERELWGMLQKEGIRLVRVDEINGAEDDGVVEIWINK